MLNCVVKLPLLNVHSFHSVADLFLAKLIIHNLFETNSFVVQKSDQAVVVAFITNNVIAALSKVVSIKFMEDNITWSAHLHRKIKCEVDIT